MVDETVFNRLHGVHEAVAIDVGLNSLDGLSRVLRDDFVEPLAHVQNLSGCDFDVGRAALEAAGRLV